MSKKRPTTGVLAKKPKGPPARITLDRLRQVVSYVSNGMDVASAARAVGVHPNTLYDWSRRGRLELTRVEDEHDVDAYELIPTTDEQWPNTRHWNEIAPHFSEIEWPFVVFAVAVEKAKAAFEARALTVIQTAMTQQWQAAAWMLERKYPERYGRPEARLRVQHEGNRENPVQVEVSVVSAHDIEQRFAEIEDALPELVIDDEDDDEQAV